ncbi:MAG: hypothetical protein PVH03_00805 [Chloroflexota bacterium]
MAKPSPTPAQALALTAATVVVTLSATADAGQAAAGATTTFTPRRRQHPLQEQRRPYSWSQQLLAWPSGSCIIPRCLPCRPGTDFRLKLAAKLFK